MDNADSVLKGIVDECLEDHVGLWVIVKDVRRAVPDPDANVFDITLSLIKRLLLEGDVVAGQFQKIGENQWKFQKWEIPLDEIITRIGREWKSLGRDPTISEVVWFTANEDRTGG